MLNAENVDLYDNEASNRVPLKNAREKPKMALALSGGGIRGYAHIGVLRAFEKAGISIDAIAGCSAGGMVGGLYAAGYSADELEREIRQLNTVRGIVKSVAPRFGRDVGFLGQLRFDYRFRDNLSNFIAPDFRFDETRIPFAVNAVCLNCGQEEMLSSGSVAEAIRAAVSVPGVFPSVVIGEGRYVDGGVLNNVPVSAARQLGGHIVIAVDVGNSRPLPTSFPFSNRTPTRVALDLRTSIDIMTSRLTQFAMEKSPPDVLIRPKLSPRLNPLADFMKIEAIIEAGYDAAQAMLPEIVGVMDSAEIHNR